MKAEEITAAEREKHAGEIARACIETVGTLPHAAYINLANYIVKCERAAQREAEERMRERCAGLVESYRPNGLKLTNLIDAIKTIPSDYSPGGDRG